MNKLRSLTRAQSFQLADWLRQNLKEFKEQQPSYITVAERASTVLEFEISPRSVSAIASDLGISWPRRNTSGKTDRVGELAKIILDMGEVLECLTPDQHSILKAIHQKQKL